MSYQQHATGEVPIVHLPGVGSLLSRSLQIYSLLFQKILHLSTLFLLGSLASFSITSFLHYIVSQSPHAVQAFVQVLTTAINLGAGLYYAFITAAILILVKEWGNGVSLTVSESLEKAKFHYKSFFWVAILFVLAINGGIVTLILAPLFSVWFYFAFFIVLFDSERGVQALEKSRYLTHGIFFKTAGRYIVVPLITSAALGVASLALLIPAAGWILFMLLALAITVFMLPFVLIFELLRYEDTLTLGRSQTFQSFPGERRSIKTWVIIGFVLMGLGWTFDLLSIDALARLRQTTALAIQRTILPVTTSLMKNQQALSSFIEKINYTYQSPNASEPQNIYNELQDLK